MSIFAPNVEPPLAPVKSLRENSCEPCQLRLPVATVFLQPTRPGGAGRLGSINGVSVKPNGILKGHEGFRQNLRRLKALRVYATEER